MQTRRQFGKLAIGAVGGFSLTRSAFATKAGASKSINGVPLGLESYSLQTYPPEGIVDLLISTLKKLDLSSCSLQEFYLLPPRVRAIVDEVGGPDRVNPQTTPEYLAKAKLADEALLEWRLHGSLDPVRAVGKKLKAAGISLDVYMPGNLRTAANSTDAELTYACEITRALGINYIAVLLSKSAARRFVPIAKKYDIKVGLHGRPSLQPANPDYISTPLDFVETVTLSKDYGIHLDTGQASAAGVDVVHFIEENHQRMTGLALKDKTKDKKSRPWGQGESHIKEILQLLRDNKYPIPCWIDCDIEPAPGRTRIDDITQCASYARTVLTS